MPTALVLLFAIACRGKDDTNPVGDDSSTGIDDSGGDSGACADEDKITFYADADADGYGDKANPTQACEQPKGYTTSKDDCDDTNGAVHPGASEVCNSIDDDCDGSTDKNATDAATWYKDLDGDGFGGDTTVTACTMPKGFAATDDDCDDHKELINPAADEKCDGHDNDCDKLVDDDDPDVVDGDTFYADSDGDGYGDPATTVAACVMPSGYVTDASDCNDVDGAVHPGKPEVCDGIDNDCDTLTDDDDPGRIGGNTYYADTDGDGYGNAGATTKACATPVGYTADNNDCNDSDATLGIEITRYPDNDGDTYGDDLNAYTECAPPHSASDVTIGGDCDDHHSTTNPAATETCTEGDENCNGLEEEADPTTVYTVWYRDSDGDGFGDTLDTLSQCDAPAGYALKKNDCDDTYLYAYPGAPEICDGHDNDCNGKIDTATVSVNWYADADGDGYGDTSDSLYQCSQPSGYVMDSTDCDDSTDTTHPGAPDICANGIDDDCEGIVDNCIYDLDDAGLVIQGTSLGQGLGITLDHGDFTGDGIGDILLGSEWANNDNGVVYIVNGPQSGTMSIADATTVSPNPKATHLYFGAVIGAGDANDDEVDDVLTAPTLGNKVYLFLGPTTTATDDLSADAVIDTPTPLDLDVVPDVDGDGESDLVLVSDKAYVLAGTTSGSVSAALDSTYQYTGGSMILDGTKIDILIQKGVDMGDTNGDGIDELALGATNANDGVIYVVDGGTTPGAHDAQKEALATISSEGEFVNCMTTTDYNDDGYSDIIVDAPEVLEIDKDHFGATYAFLGPLSGDLTDVDANTRWDSAGGAGKALAAADFDGDGSIDIGMGNPYGEYFQGFAFVQFGLTTGVVADSSMVSIPGKEYEYFATSMDWVPDWTGDGGDELVVGASSLGATGDWGAGGNGGAYVIFSGDLY